MQTETCVPNIRNPFLGNLRKCFRNGTLNSVIEILNLPWFFDDMFYRTNFPYDVIYAIEMSLVYIFRIISIGVLCCFPYVSYAKLSIEKKLIHAVVPVSSSEYSFSYPFKNTGDRVVKILKITTTCGCTKAEADREVYAPGESGKITGVFEIGDRVGRQGKKIYVETDDPKNLYDAIFGTSDTALTVVFLAK